jgi:hypothetical protein
MGVLALNLMLNIYNYKMYTLKKAPIFIFHIGFLVILFGAAVTRYVGFEGNMHIREGSSAASITSAATFVTLRAMKEGEKAEASQAVYFSKRSSNSLEESLKVKDERVSMEMIEYIPDAVETLVEDKINGKPVVKFMITSNGNGKPIALEFGEYFDGGDFILDFQSGLHFDKPTVSMFLEGESLYMRHPQKLSYFRMADRKKGALEASEKELLNQRVLYSLESGSSFVLRDFMPKASKKLVSSSSLKMNRKMKMNSSGVDALRFALTVNGMTKELLVYGQNGVVGTPSNVKFGDMSVSVAYGAKEIMLPFEIKLVDFQLDRYPGSMSPASYASEVVLIDKEQGVNMPYRIFMNNILEHRGYRFCQASYDRDEKGTVLSVNNDPGTLPSYIGYLLLAIGMFWSLFSKEHRFAKLGAKAKKACDAKIVPALLTLALLCSVTPSQAAELDPAIKTILSFDKEHSGKFGQLIIQDAQGRMKPMNTLATEILAKMYRGATLKIGSSELNADQVILGMMIRPDIYKNVKLIRTKDPKINEAIGAKLDAKYVSFAQFFQDPDGMRGYKLGTLVEEATRKAPKNRNKLDKAALKIDEKVNVAYMVFTGSLLKMWPLAGDPSNKWFATIEALQTFAPELSQEVREAAVAYFTSVDDALTTHAWGESNAALKKIAAYQHKYGAAVYPSANKIKAEVFYNNSNIFEILWPLYFIMGFILLILSFAKILYPKLGMLLVTRASLGFLVLFFIGHTMGLAHKEKH